MSNLRNWMAQQGKVQGPDGQLTVVKNPEQAHQLAAKWINDELGRQQKAQEERQKAQEKAANDAQKAQVKAQKESQKQSEQQQKDREKAGEPTIEQRAKTLMDANPERNPVPLLQRQLGLGYSAAKVLADKVRQTAPIEAAPKVGGEGHEVVEESRATVDKQVQALQAGTIKAVHIPAGSTYTPQIPDGMKAVDVKNGPGAGRFIYNAAKLRAATIKDAARNGSHGDLLGHIQAKQEVAQSENPVVVQARDNDGTVIQDSTVDGNNPGAVQAQTESLQERHPNANVQVVSPNDAINERLTEKNNEEPDLTAGIEEQKYKFGNTQATIPAGSDAHTAIRGLQSKVDDADLAGDGKDIDEPHVTVRYGIQGEDTSGIRKYIESLAPFDARLGKTSSFPPSEHSDGAAPIIATIESPELHQINAEIEKHGDFTEPNFKEYKPHATIAYVKPEAAAKYEGMADAHGKTFRVTSIDISNRYGDKETVQLKGASSAPENQGGATPEVKPTTSPRACQARRKRWIRTNCAGSGWRIRTASDKRRRSRHLQDQQGRRADREGCTDRR
jgi:2'-5' RNA ligase